jgi:hypothetical protein
MTLKQLMKITTMNNRLAQMVEMCRQPDITVYIIAEALGMDRKNAIYYLWKLKTEDNPYIISIPKGVQSGSAWQTVYKTIRECAYVRPDKVVRLDAPEDPICARLMGYTTFKPQGGHVYTESDFNALKRKHNGIWNPDDKPKHRNSVSGSTLSMVV